MIPWFTEKRSFFKWEANPISSHPALVDVLHRPTGGGRRKISSEFPWFYPLLPFKPHVITIRLSARLFPFLRQGKGSGGPLEAG